ncbi:MAG: HAD family hydrolase [Gammaproteobacteria bacterium]
MAADKKKTSDEGVVFLLDVDNTLLDNDRFKADLGERLEQALGAVQRDRYWAIYARLRGDLGYADYLTTLQKLRIGLDDDPDLLQMSAFMLDYPFDDRLYPRTLDAVAHLGTLGRPVVLSDGDVVFQPRKIQRSGIWDAVEGRVLIYLHKERTLPEMQRRYPASHYVMVDDKPWLLATMKSDLDAKLTTVFVRQGHYAVESAGSVFDPPPDLSIDHIGELLTLDLADFLPSQRWRAAASNEEEEED